MGSNIADNLPLVFIVLAIVAFLFFFRKGQRPERTRAEIIYNLLSEVKLDQAMVETFALREKLKKFEVVSWQRNKTRLSFVGDTLRGNLSKAFGSAEELNRQMDAAKKSKETDARSKIDVAVLREPLAKSRDGLEEWLLIHTGRKEPPIKYPTIMDDLFGTGG